MTIWRMLLAFLPTKSLKYLEFWGAIDRYAVVEAVSLLENNTSLEVLIVQAAVDDNESSDDDDEEGESSVANSGGDTRKHHRSFISARAVEDLKLNCTLRHFHIVHPFLSDMDQSDAGSQLLVRALRNDFGIGMELSGSWKNPVEMKQLRRPMMNILQEGRSQSYQEEIEAICLLNKAGRRYLLNDPSNKARGVQVFGDVASNLNSLFSIW